MSKHKGIVLWLLLSLIVVSGCGKSGGHSRSNGGTGGYGGPTGTVEVDATYFVDQVQGSDDNDGKTLDRPFKTINRVLTLVQPGDVVCIRGGVYQEQITFKISGAPGHPIVWQAYPGEEVIIDGLNREVCEREPYSIKDQIEFDNCNWQVLRGFIVRNSPAHGITVNTGSNHNVIEFVKAIDNYGNGILIRGDDNQVLDCEASYNFDYAGDQSTNPPQNPGENADGISLDGRNCVAKRCVVHHNGDDGFDCWYGAHGTIEECIAYQNGSNEGCRNRNHGSWSRVTFAGNGNGFKLGRGGRIYPGWTLSGQAYNTVIRCLAYENQASGFTTNGGGGNQILNCTAFRNNRGGYGGCYDFNSFDYVDNTGEKRNTFKNNLASDNCIPRGTTMFVTNSWDLNIVMSEGYFVSTNPLSQDFLRLAPGSPYINAGNDIGLPFSGAKPDLGCYESSY